MLKFYQFLFVFCFIITLLPYCSTSKEIFKRNEQPINSTANSIQEEDMKRLNFLKRFEYLRPDIPSLPKLEFHDFSDNDRKLIDFLRIITDKQLIAKIIQNARKNIDKAFKDQSYSTVNDVVKRIYYFNETLLDYILEKSVFSRLCDFYKIMNDSKEIQHEIGKRLENFLIFLIKNPPAEKFSIEIEMFKKLFVVNEKIHDNVMCSALKSAYQNKESFFQLIKNVWPHQYASQKATILICIFENLEILPKNVKDKEELTLFLASYLYKIKIIDDFTLMNEKKWKILEKYSEKLPNQLKLLYSDDKLCIKNVHSNKYLAVGEPLNEETHRHYVISKDVIDETTQWKIVAEWPTSPNISENFVPIKIKNVKYRNAFLYNHGIWGRVSTWDESSTFVVPRDAITWVVNFHDDKFVFSTVLKEFLGITDTKVMTTFSKIEEGHIWELEKC